MKKSFSVEKYRIIKNVLKNLVKDSFRAKSNTSHQYQAQSVTIFSQHLEDSFTTGKLIPQSNSKYKNKINKSHKGLLNIQEETSSK